MPLCIVGPTAFCVVWCAALDVGWVFDASSDLCLERRLQVEQRHVCKWFHGLGQGCAANQLLVCFGAVWHAPMPSMLHLFAFA